MKQFLDALDAWQIAHRDVRVTAATFPGAAQRHANAFCGFEVTDGPPVAVLNTGERVCP